MGNTRGKRGVAAIDSGPFEMGELAVKFREMPLRELAGAWVGCVVDSVSYQRPTVGDTARALIVVAERLHEVRFAEPVIAEVKMSKSFPPRPTSHFERPLGLPEPQSPFALKATRKITTRVGDSIAAPANPIKRRPGVQKRSELSHKIEALKPGEEVRELLREYGGQRTRTAVGVMVSVGKKNGWDKRLRTRVDGQHIVVYIPKEESAS